MACCRAYIVCEGEFHRMGSVCFGLTSDGYRVDSGRALLKNQIDLSEGYIWTFNNICIILAVYVCIYSVYPRHDYLCNVLTPGAICRIFFCNALTIPLFLYLNEGRWEPSIWQKFF